MENSEENTLCMLILGLEGLMLCALLLYRALSDLQDQMERGVWMEQRYCQLF